MKNERADKMRAAYNVYAKFKRAMYVSNSEARQEECLHKLSRPDEPATRE